MPAALEADCGVVHPVTPRGEYEEAQLHRFLHGGVRGGVQSAALLLSHLLLTTHAYGCQFQETAGVTRRR